MPIEEDDEVVLLQGTVMVSIVTIVEMAVEVAFLLIGHRFIYGIPVSHFSSAFAVCHMVKSEAKHTFTIMRPMRCRIFQALNGHKKPQNHDPNAICPHSDKSDAKYAYARLTEFFFICLRREYG